VRVLTGLIILGLVATLACSTTSNRPTAYAAHFRPAYTQVSLAMPSIEVSRALLDESWTQYKKRFIQNDGRVIDRKANGISTSEGQAYAMLRAVWMNDRTTFDRALRWADDNLNAGARGDRLYGWKWGQRTDGQWGVIDPVTASDADQLIAYALILGHRRWKDSGYGHRASALLQDIWQVEVTIIRGKPYLLPGDWKESGRQLKINPSYYLPFAYRAFATLDPKHPWEKLIDSTYRVLRTCRSTVGLPTDWCFLDANSGALSIPMDIQDRTGDFGYEALRVYWNLAADARWHKEPRADQLLGEFGWLYRYWVLQSALPAVITVGGIPRQQHESLALYGAILPAMARFEPAQTTVLYQTKIANLYHVGLWGDPDDYYAQNWVWFGLALLGDLDRTD